MSLYLTSLGFTAFFFFVINGWRTIGLHGGGTVTLIGNSGNFKVGYSLFLCKHLLFALFFKMVTANSGGSVNG